MSLYCFGKVKFPRDGITSSLPNLPSLFWGLIDPSDAAEIDSISDLAGEGHYFSIASRKGDPEATSLWNEAMDAPLDKLLNTTLGRIVNALIIHPEIEVGGLAFVDGGIENVLRGTRDDCWRWFCERIGRAWDDIDNPLLVWRAS